MYPKYGDRQCDDGSATLLAYLACTDAGEICCIKCVKSSVITPKQEDI